MSHSSVEVQGVVQTVRCCVMRKLAVAAVIVGLCSPLAGQDASDGFGRFDSGLYGGGRPDWRDDNISSRDAYKISQGVIEGRIPLNFGPGPGPLNLDDRSVHDRFTWSPGDFDPRGTGRGWRSPFYTGPGGRRSLGFHLSRPPVAGESAQAQREHAASARYPAWPDPWQQRDLLLAPISIVPLNPLAPVPPATPFAIGQIVDGEVPLVTDVDVESPDQIAPGAVAAVVTIRDPNLPMHSLQDQLTFVKVQIPPRPVRILRISPCRTRIEMDFGRHDVQVHSAAGRVLVRYAAAP